MKDEKYKTKSTLLRVNVNGNDTRCAYCNKLMKGGKNYPAIGNGALFFCNEDHATKGLNKLQKAMA